MRSFSGLAVVVYGLYGEEPAAPGLQRLLDDGALLPDQLLECRALGIVDGVAGRGGPGTVVVPDAAEGAEADGGRLPSSVEGGPHGVEVDEEIGVDDGPVDLDVEASPCVAQVYELFGVFSVVAV